MSAPRWLRLAAPAAVGMLAAVLAGCSLRGELAPNLPPETSVFVQGTLDTVSHTVHLYWTGSDSDGEVKGFEWRFVNPQTPADTTWKFTTRTDSVFVVQDSLGYVAPRFDVRTVDDQNAVDPTPATQGFQFSNQAPTVTILTKPSATDSTFASVTITWRAADLDGDPDAIRFRIWLDGREDQPRVVTGRSYTVPSADFGVPGTYASRARTLYIQPIDDGGRAGNVDSTRWFVRAPTTGARARLLIVDDVPSTNTANVRIDTLYANTAARNLQADEYSVLRLQFSTPFRSAEDLRQTFDLFDAVVWYRGNEITFSTTLRDFEAGIRDYVSAGGRFYLDGLYLIAGRNATGPLAESFTRDVLQCDGFVINFSTTINDSTAGWGNVNQSVFRSDALADSIRQQLLGVRAFEAAGMRWFRGADPANVLLYAQPGSLSPANPENAPVGLSVPQPGGGRCVVVTVPLGTSTTFPGTPAFNSAPRLLAKIFQQLGLTGP